MLPRSLAAAFLLSTVSFSQAAPRDFFNCTNVDPESGLQLGRPTGYAALMGPATEEEALRSIGPAFDVAAWSEVLQKKGPELESGIVAFILSSNVDLPQILARARGSGFFCFLKSPPREIVASLYNSILRRQIFHRLDWKTLADPLNKGPVFFDDLYYAFRWLLLIDLLDPAHVTMEPRAPQMLYYLHETFEQWSLMVEPKIDQKSLTELALQGRRPKDLSQSLMFRALQQTGARTETFHWKNLKAWRSAL